MGVLSKIYFIRCEIKDIPGIGKKTYGGIENSGEYQIRMHSKKD